MRFIEYLIEEDFNVKKYHKDVGFPPNWIRDYAKFITNLPELRPSEHWQKERSYKHNFSITKAQLKPSDIFELAYTNDGKLIKVGYRIKNLSKIDDVIVIILYNGKIVTSWLNSKSDVHKTLNTSKYIPQQLGAR